jgi:hypothetical protein
MILAVHDCSGIFCSLQNHTRLFEENDPSPYKIKGPNPSSLEESDHYEGKIIHPIIKDNNGLINKNKSLRGKT